MERVRQWFQAFSSRVGGFFGGLRLCQKASTNIMVPVDLSGAPVVDLSGARTLTSDPEDAKALKVCEVEASEKCKGCDCSVDTSKETRGLKLLVPASA